MLALLLIRLCADDSTLVAAWLKFSQAAQAAAGMTESPSRVHSSAPAGCKMRLAGLAPERACCSAQGQLTVLSADNCGGAA